MARAPVDLSKTPSNAAHKPGGRRPGQRIQRLLKTDKAELNAFEREEREYRDKLANDRKNRKQLLLRVPIPILREIFDIAKEFDRKLPEQFIECAKLGARFYRPDSTVLGSRSVLDMLPSAGEAAVMDSEQAPFHSRERAMAGNNEALHAPPDELEGSWVGKDAGLPGKPHRTFTRNANKRIYEQPPEGFGAGEEGDGVDLDLTGE